MSTRDCSSDELRARLDSARAGTQYQTEQVIDAITEAITDRMDQLGLSRAELAQRLGVTPARITNVLRGANFTVRTLVEIGRALECDLTIDLMPRDYRSSVRPTGAEVAAESGARYGTTRRRAAYASRDAEIRGHLESGKLKVEDGTVLMWREREATYAPATFRTTQGREGILRTNVGSRAYYKHRILAVAEVLSEASTA